MRTKKTLLNIVFSLLSKVITIILGFAISKLILVTYGSSIFGMVASTRQFIKYLSLFEMGIAGSVIYALYKPLAEKNNFQIGQILNEAKKYYLKSGLFFIIGALVLSSIYPFIIKDNEVEKTTAYFVFLLLSVNTALDFLAFAKYKVLFIADQKEYVVSICNIIQVITYSIFAIIVIKYNYSIIVLQLTVVLGYLLRSLVLYIFYNKTYINVSNMKDVKNTSIVTQKRDVMWHEISWLILSSSPIIIMTIFYSLKQLSVFSVYNLVIANVFIVISIFNSAFTSSFGEILANKSYKLFNNIFHEFEFIYFSLASFLLLNVFELIQPFINVYSKGISDIDYNNLFLIIMMLLLSFANSLRVPSSILIGITGNFKELTKVTNLITVFCLILSFAFAFVSFELILLGSILGYIAKAIVFMKKANGFSVGYEIKKSYKSIFISILLFIIVYLLTSNFVNDLTHSYMDWFINALIITILNALIYFILMILFEKTLMKRVLFRMQIKNKFLNQ